MLGEQAAAHRGAAPPVGLPRTGDQRLGRRTLHGGCRHGGYERGDARQPFLRSGPARLGEGRQGERGHYQSARTGDPPRATDSEARRPGSGQYQARRQRRGDADSLGGGAAEHRAVEERAHRGEARPESGEEPALAPAAPQPDGGEAHRRHRRERRDEDGPRRCGCRREDAQGDHTPRRPTGRARRRKEDHLCPGLQEFRPRQPQQATESAAVSRPQTDGRSREGGEGGRPRDLLRR